MPPQHILCRGRSSSPGKNCPLNTAPMHFSVFDQWLVPRTVPYAHRPYDVACTLRARQDAASPSSAGRWNVVQWLRETQRTRPYRVRVGPVLRNSDNCIDSQYLRLLHRARIVVTCQPAHWEGDYRMWESLASGALVFIDPVATPLPFRYHPSRPDSSTMAGGGGRGGWRRVYLGWEVWFLKLAAK